MTSRRLFTSSALIGSLTVVGCNIVTSPTVNTATVTKILSYAQAAISSLKVVVALFGSQMSASVQASVSNALAGLEAAAASVGTDIANASSSTTTAGDTQSVISALQIAVDAILAALSLIPGAGAAVAIAKEVALLIPVIQSLVTSILTPSAPAPVPTARIGNAAARLGVIAR